MGEDKLTYKQRVRLEALAQAIAYNSIKMGTLNSLDDVLKEAENIENWLHKAERIN